MADRSSPRLRAVHRALADPLRIQLYELVSGRSRSARELAELTGRPPNRLYHHLAQLEEAGLIEVAEYRDAGGGKVERIYAPVTAEPPGEEAAPAERAQFLSAMLEETRAEIVAASQAEEAGEQRYVSLIRSPVRVSEGRLARLQAVIEEFIREAQEQPDPDGVWTTVLWTAVARQGKPQVPQGP